MLVQPPRRPTTAGPGSDGRTAPVHFRIHGDSNDGSGTPAPSTPNTYSTEAGAWGATRTWADTEDSTSTHMDID
eukprot:3573617-Alexandrium_andersonii.AAC.1